MQTTTQQNTNGRTITSETYFVFYGEHESGSGSRGFLVREGLESAERSERLLGECGYARTDIRHADSISELFGN